MTETRNESRPVTPVGITIGQAVEQAQSVPAGREGDQ